MSRRPSKASKSGEPLVKRGEPWLPMKTPCVSPELNFDGPDPDPRVVMLVEIATKPRLGDEFAIRLTADEAEELSADLSRQAAAIRELSK